MCGESDARVFNELFYLLAFKHVLLPLYLCSCAQPSPSFWPVASPCFQSLHRQPLCFFVYFCCYGGYPYSSLCCNIDLMLSYLFISRTYLRGSTQEPLCLIAVFAFCIWLWGLKFAITIIQRPCLIRALLSEFYVNGPRSAFWGTSVLSVCSKAIVLLRGSICWPVAVVRAFVQCLFC